MFGKSWLLVVPLLVGCGSSQPKTVEIKINGETLPVALKEAEPENNPEQAAADLAKQKAKWLDDAGELKEGLRRGTSNKAMAAQSFESIAHNHPATPAGKEAKAIADKLAQ